MIGAHSILEDGSALTEQIRSGRLKASEVIATALSKIERLDTKLNCFTATLVDSAQRQAEDIDRKIAAGEDPGPLAGVPFAVKNLFDIAGLTTLAGSTIQAKHLAF